MKVPCVNFDFETYNELDLTQVGSWRYSEHPSLDLLSLAYRIDDGPVLLYRPYENDELPYAFFDAIENGAILSAWNVAFEYSVWMNHCVKRLSWPEPGKIQWKDTAAKAAAHALPLALDKCGIALNLPDELLKFKSGKAILKKLAGPDPKTGRRTMRNDAPRTFQELYAYNVQDVITESHIDKTLIDLKPHEADFWFIDQLINHRGIPIDADSVWKIARRVKAESKKANDKLPKLSGGRIERVTQVQRIVKFAQDSGIKINNCQAQTVDKVLDFVEKHPDRVNSKNANAIEILKYRKFYGKSAVSKYEKMLGCVADDGRVHYTMVFRGAHTGRWAGRLIQPHNYFKPTIHKNSDVDHFVDCVSNRPIECTEAIYQPFIHAAASATRMMLAAPKGKTFFIGDYNAIEARGALWLADDQDGLDIWRSGRDPYCEMASKIFNRSITKEDEYERFIGKGIVLGAAYGLGWRGFINTMRDQWGVDIPENLAKTGIDAFRSKHHKVVELWNKTEKAAVRAIRYPGEVFRFKHLAFCKPKDKEFLYMMLPSRRLLAYPFPKMENRKTKWGKWKQTITYMALINNHWQRTFTYGGSIIENGDQGLCAEIMADGMTNVEFAGLPVTFTVHDELILELFEKTAREDAKRAHAILETPPSWAKGFPIKVEAILSHRYKKA